MYNQALALLLKKEEREKIKITKVIKFVFGYKFKNKFILLIILFYLLFICLIIFFDIIYRYHCIILVKFYFYLVYKKNFTFIYNIFNKKILILIK